MNDADIDGRLLQRWLKTDAVQPSLLSGCGLDDGDCEAPLPILEVDLDRQVLVCAAPPGRARIPFARLADCLLVAPVGHPAIAAVQACVSPEERAHNRMLDALGPEYPRAFASVADLEAVYAAEMARREGKLPDRALRGPWVRALKRNDLHRQGAQLAQSWRDLANAVGAPWSDIALHLAWFQRHAGHPNRAIETARDFWRSKAPASQTEIAMLATVEAAALIDRFTRKGGAPPDLVEARRAAAKAYAIAPADPEIQAVYQRLKAIENGA
ncbi:hypothetical protein [Caulobacter soli]|uniref:hypothetical protein n=1 Tax=Caulobacter soli TaxID=2708539 RepID=UPI0013EB8BE6|nr:hypothetical protein [Caulobacter soli]